MACLPLLLLAALGTLLAALPVPEMIQVSHRLARRFIILKRMLRKTHSKRDSGSLPGQGYVLHAA